ncbi:membrane protein [Basilea psittacipulmonis DSM 24701]|uniref:Probable membrane transporter protein n=2 Tax=Basilea TaxID=1472344 RepID=A0A077DDC5_9BURK|nr:membrane protein [Basilea psittacipulmonis DSM 24701]
MDVVNSQLGIEWIFLILLGVSFVAGFIDAIAGGGGMITIPALLLCGIAPINALATNKLQGTFGALTASIAMLRKRIIHFSQVRITALFAFLGSVIGTITVQFIDSNQLSFVIPIVLLLIALYYLFNRSIGQIESKPRVSDKVYQTTVIPAIGFYDGFLGPGTGSFFALANVALKGMDLVRATAASKVFNLATNIASCLLFIMGGKVIWSIGAVMIVGQMTGAYFGSRLLIAKGASFIRPMVVITCFIMLARYMYNYF